ncbi:hypothetical protein [Sphingobacterium multivorum]|uniref:hypothetical protein n=1 Tax=Sphingobacterium multivorum TaxID=28454 RepID=UPI002FD92FCD
MEKNKLSEDFLEDIQDSIAEFEMYMIHNGYDVNESIEMINVLSRTLKEKDATEYEVINRIIVYTSSWGELQDVLLNKYLYSMITSTYLKEIDKDPKRILYLLSLNSIQLRGNSIDKLFHPLKEFARDKVLLDSSSKNKRYEPSFIGRFTSPTSLIPPRLKDAALKDVLNSKGLKNISIIEDYIKEAIIYSKKGTKAKAVIPVFKAIDALSLIDEGYAETFTKPVDLASFISRVTQQSFSKDDVLYWTPAVFGSSKYSQDEFEKHKKALKNILI